MIDNDEVLIKGLKRGLIAAQERFYYRYHDQVMGQCLRILRNKEDAEDAASIALNKVMRNIARFKGDSKFSSWVYRITQNEIYMVFRIKKRSWYLTPIEDLTKEVRSHNEPRYESRSDPILRRRILRAMDRIPDIYKAAFYQACVMERPNEESAVVCGSTVPAIKSRKFRAKRHFKRLLQAA